MGLLKITDSLSDSRETRNYNNDIMSWRAQISRNLREIRIVCAQQAENSKGVRQFFDKNYHELKMLNPSTPMFYREMSEISPFLYARYDWGKEKKVDVSDMTDKEVTEQLKQLVELGKTMPKSAESDVILDAPIVDYGKEDEADPINMTWDGKTVRRNPDFDLEVVDDLKDHPKYGAAFQ